MNKWEKMLEKPWKDVAGIYVHEYNHFMDNPKNAMNCEDCPENKGHNQGIGPCGQQHCWVDIHCGGKNGN